MVDLLSGNLFFGEIFLVVGCFCFDVLMFKLVVWDNDLCGGGWGIDEMEIEIDFGLGFFVIVLFNGGEMIGGLIVVQWDVVGIDVVLVLCFIVDVLLFIDGGVSFLMILVL